MGSQLSKNSESQRKSQLLSNNSKSEDKTNTDPNQSSNRRKSSIDSDISPNYISSSAIKAIGSNSLTQSNSVSNWRQQSVGSRNSSKTITIPAEIVVVSDGSAAQESDQTITFPPTFKPIIPIGYESLSLSYPQINPQIVVDLGLLLEEDLRKKAESVAKEQNKVIDRIKDIDVIVAYITTQFINERQKRLNKVSENLSKAEEIYSLIEKCETDINKCANSLEKLNNYLPKNLCLEKFEFQPTG